MDIEKIKRELGASLIDALTQDELITRAYNLGHAQGFTEGVAKWANDAAPVKESLTTEPELSRFLPKMPDDLPSLPDGWVYVGKGINDNLCKNAPSEYIKQFKSFDNIWFCPAIGTSPIGFYAVRIDAPADIWARFGLMPYEHLFYSHMPGDPMPCERELMINLCNPDYGPLNSNYYAGDMNWDTRKKWGWRPADWLERRERVREQNNKGE